jgi:hypothetical protein
MAEAAAKAENMDAERQALNNDTNAYTTAQRTQRITIDVSPR